MIFVVQIFAIRVLNGVILILLGDICDLDSFLGHTGFIFPLFCLIRLLFLILVELLQTFPHKLDCYHFAFLLGIRVRDALDKFAPLKGILPVVGFFLVFDQTLYILFAVHVNLFSLNKRIFNITVSQCLVLLAHSTGIGAQ